MYMMNVKKEKKINSHQMHLRQDEDLILRLNIFPIHAYLGIENEQAMADLKQED